MSIKQIVKEYFAPLLYLKFAFKLIRSRIFLAVLSVVVLVTIYALVSHNQHKKNPDDTTIPTATQLYHGIEKSISVNSRTETRWIVVDASASFKRLFLGLGIGILGSIILGIMMACFKVVENFFYVPITLLAKVPPTAALAVFFVMVGTGLEMYIAMIAFGILPTLTESVRLMVKDIPSENLDKARTLGASKFEEIWDIIFPQIFPRLIDAIRLQLGPSIVFLIAAEMVCGDMGFGYRIRLQSRLLDMSVVYPYIVFLMAFGFFMDSILKLTIRICCPWYGKGQS